MGLRRVGLAVRESGVFVWAGWLVGGACGLDRGGMITSLSESLSSDGSRALLRRGRPTVDLGEQWRRRILGCRAEGAGRYALLSSSDEESGSSTSTGISGGMSDAGCDKGD
jgi:hypothetical protein